MVLETKRVNHMRTSFCFLPYILKMFRKVDENHDINSLKGYVWVTISIEKSVIYGQ